jgi:hypothetical protein
MNGDSLAEIEKLPQIAARMSYRVVGSFAVFLHVECVDWAAARLTGVVDFEIDGDDSSIDVALATIRMTRGTSDQGWTAILSLDDPRAYSRFRWRSGNVGSAVRVPPGVMVMPVPELVRLNLQNFRLKEQLHVQDMDWVGLITPEIEVGLSEALRVRLAEVRATE